VTDAAANAYGARGGGVSVTSGTINLVFNARDLVGRLTPYVWVGAVCTFATWSSTTTVDQLLQRVRWFLRRVRGRGAVRSRTQFVPAGTRAPAYASG